MDLENCGGCSGNQCPCKKDITSEIDELCEHCMDSSCSYKCNGFDYGCENYEHRKESGNLCELYKHTKK